mgnify:FL=1
MGPTSIYADFASTVFILCPHINSVNQGMPVQGKIEIDHLLLIYL